MLCAFMEAATERAYGQLGLFVVVGLGVVLTAIVCWERRRDRRRAAAAAKRVSPPGGDSLSPLVVTVLGGDPRARIRLRSERPAAYRMALNALRVQAREEARRRWEWNGWTLDDEDACVKAAIALDASRRLVGLGEDEDELRAEVIRYSLAVN